MKKFLLASAALFSLTGVASAADLRVNAPIVAPVPVFSWTGCYIGGHVGYGKAQSSHNFQFEAEDAEFEPKWYFTNNFENKGAVGGLQAGCNYQAGLFVFGIEGDYSAANLKANYDFTGVDADDDTQVASFHSKVESLSSVRGRFGVAADRAFLYATMGVAWAKFNYDFSVAELEPGETPNAGSYSVNANGIVFGAGVNYAVTDWLILRAEYLHYNFGTDTLLPQTHPELGPGPNDHFTLKDVDVIRVGADWKFNWWSTPVVARY